MKKGINDYLTDNKFVAALIIGITILLMLVSNFVLNTSLYYLAKLNKTAIHSNISTMYKIFHFPIMNYRLYYFIAYLSITIVDIKILYSLKTSFKNINVGQKGTSRFTTLRELKKQYKAVPESGEKYKGKGGVIISRYKDKIFIDDSPTNNTIIGITRSGKGETFVFPTIDVYSRAEEKPSLIMNDPKGELVAASYETLKNRGYDIEILNLLTPDEGMSYNPLQLVIDAYKNGEYSTAQLLCNTLTFSLYNDPTAKDKFWQESAQSLVNALILAVTEDCVKNNEEEKITLFTVANMLSELGGKEDEDGNNALDLFFQERDPFDIAKMQYATSNFSKGTTRGSIFAAAMSKLQIFTFDKIGRMTSKNSYKLENIGFGEKPVAIFMVSPDYDTSTHVLASIFIRQIYFILAKTASLKSGKCDREVVFLLDEFGNMPAIEGFANIMTVCLGRNIRFNLIIQAFSQLKKIYGDDSKTILGNCGNIIYILTSEYDTAKSISNSLGFKTIVNDSLNGKELSLWKSTTKSVDKRELLTPNELMSLQEGEDIVVRVIKRQDKNRKRIVPRPIYNHDLTRLKYRYEYLNDYFDTNKKLKDLNIESDHKNVDLRSLIFTPHEDYEKEDICNYQLTEKDKIGIEKILKRNGIEFDLYILDDESIKDKIFENRSLISGEDFQSIEKIIMKGGA